MEMGGMIEGLIQQAERSIPRAEGDYTKDGLLYCGKCKTPKECRVMLLGEMRKVRCVCRCERDRLDAEEADRKRKEKAQQIQKLRSVGFPDAEMQKWTFERDDGSNTRLSTICRRYVENWTEVRNKGKGLLFYGPVATGKTFFAACVANALIDKGYSCMVTNFSRVTNTLFSVNDKQEYIDELNRFDLLVIDDLAAERDTEYMGELIFSVIDGRYRSGKPLIVTTNLTAEELKNPDGIRRERVFSRLYEMCFAVEVNGGDRRKATMISDFKEMKGMLGL
ncbi:MAG: ATP-binding protein [Oscillospiraceae bacterium]|nr:ATP-binding protein [Oscillospiraceae bacterium]